MPDGRRPVRANLYAGEVSSTDDETRPPGQGWSLGADGFSKAFWLFMTVVLVVIGVILLTSGYVGYGGMLLVLGGAAFVNVLP